MTKYPVSLIIITNKTLSETLIHIITEVNVIACETKEQKPETNDNGPPHSHIRLPLFLIIEESHT